MFHIMAFWTLIHCFDKQANILYYQLMNNGTKLCDYLLATYSKMLSNRFYIKILIPYIKFVVSLKCKCEKISHNIKSLWAPEYFCSNVNIPITSAPYRTVRLDCNACVLVLVRYWFSSSVPVSVLKPWFLRYLGSCSYFSIPGFRYKVFRGLMAFSSFWYWFSSISVPFWLQTWWNLKLLNWNLNWLEPKLLAVLHVAAPFL